MAEVETKPQHRSHSQFSSYVKCGEQYRLEKVVGVKRAPAVWNMGGTAFHSAAEHYERGKFHGFTPSVKETLEVWHADFERLRKEALAEEPDESKWLTAGRPTKDRPRGEDVQHWREIGPPMVERYIKFSEQSEAKIWELPTGDPALEVAFTITLGDLSVRGAIDSVWEFPNGSLLVRDYKSGSRKPDSSAQLGLYGVALGQLFGIVPHWGDFYMARKAETVGLDDLTVWTEERLTRMYGDMDRAVRAGIFIPVIGSMCGKCSVRDYCVGVGGSKAHKFDHIR